ncbi:carbamoyltransferase HypF [Shewanella sp. SNU WT4]|uniref:carbamoyltransferase HypF n=1 Tax=Shewanella sp. SNU WT4 TaxID=2590015 RepID=UPI00112B76CD|nr:carbamoyltransferase HypF [Shewanella sp. SNU WT4]QDF66976.1 carbamoyltransferase HypF [Shewanella sp. SNU WT4]
MITRQRIHISGIVQGVGFRPYVYRYALEFGLSGTVLNNSAGVTIEVQGERPQIEQFTQKLQLAPPPLARIDNWQQRTIEIVNTALDETSAQFRIIRSDNCDDISVSISPDKACCADCCADISDPNSRYFNYPFTNCTNCGPRYTIIKDLPYDRPNTAMAHFAMCSECRAEYLDPLNRRYHAQPISCPKCGPRLSLLTNTGEALSHDAQALDDAASALLAGKIVAIKGLGGFHLMCDATNANAVQSLRDRKHRPSKPLAIMAANLTMAKSLVSGNDMEWQLLQSPERPILLMRLPSSEPELAVSANIAPGLGRLGIFLPYTPLHHLLLAKVRRPLVATSANISGEPIITSSAAIVSQLAHVVDQVLDNDRDIINGCDDSIIQVIDNQRQMIRLARGFAPLSMPLENHTIADANDRPNAACLALGPQQKNSLALRHQGQMILSPHVGDLYSLASQSYFDRTLASLQQLYRIAPTKICHDHHPDYHTSRLANAATSECSTLAVQHHHAHVLSVMAINQVTEPVLGFAFDGTGLGDDGSLWGGELLECTPTSYQRLGHFTPLTMIGMEQATQQPVRLLAALLFEHMSLVQIRALPIKALQTLSASQLANLHQLWRNHSRCIRTSSAGRLFDLVALLLGEIHQPSFEAQAGMILTKLAEEFQRQLQPLPADCQWEIEIIPVNATNAANTSTNACSQWNSQQLLLAIIQAVQAKPLTPQRQGQIALGFMQALANLVANIAKCYPGRKLVLCGGVFQNPLLLSLTRQALAEVAIELLPSGDIPINDGGIAFGQLWAGIHQPLMQDALNQ